MSNRGVILLATGMLVLGLIVGGLVGGVSGFFMGRDQAFARNTHMQGFEAPGQSQVPNQTNPQFTPRGGFQQQTTSDGAQVTQVETGSPAARAGLQQGDVITAVGGTKLDAKNALADLIAAKKPGDKVELSVMRGTQTLTITVELGASPQNASAAYLGIRYGAPIQNPGGGGRNRQPGSQNNNLPGG